MNSTPRTLLVALGAMASVTFIIAACGSSSDSTFGDPDGGNGPGFTGDGGLGTTKPDAGDPYANDPPPKYCVLAGQSTPPPPGGTADCPDDKNKPGCGCANLGETAACWTGLRVNRHLGQCKDGTTTCTQVSENVRAWGACDGEVLPAAGQTKGKAACKCFSAGQWKLANLSPCFVSYNGGNAPPWYAVSTTVDPTTKISNCPTIANTPPPVSPDPVWTTDTLNVDCAGHFKVCFELKAGNYDAPVASDCSITGKLCVEADYLKENVDQPFPPLPHWNSSDSACIQRWKDVGGYGEMSVIGESVLCDKVDDGAGNAYVFNRVKFCPAKCEGGANPTDPDCAKCQQGGSGQF
jgi:hypothetical protein